VSGRRPVTHVVCFGNPWHGDDGFGLHVFRGLENAIPDRVKLFDAGTAGLDALPCFEGCAKAVIVDAVRLGGRVGTVYRLATTDLEPGEGMLTLHDVAVNDLLAALRIVMREPPEIVLIGAEIGEIRAFDDQLSAPLNSAVSVAIRLVLDEARQTSSSVTASWPTSRNSV
jgi:hydrogenase maturation protease